MFDQHIIEHVQHIYSSTITQMNKAFIGHRHV